MNMVISVKSSLLVDKLLFQLVIRVVKSTLHAQQVYTTEEVQSRRIGINVDGDV